MKKDDIVKVRFGDEVAGKTIVGGRGSVRKSRPVPVPVGIEKVLYMAASDPKFRQKLFIDRESVLADPRLKLDETEKDILLGVPPEQLEMMIGRIDPVGHGKRNFISRVAVAAVGLAATLAVDPGCGGDPAGISPGDAGWDAGHNDGAVQADVWQCCDAGGARPDGGWDTGHDDTGICTDVDACPNAGGARPDEDGDAGQAADGSTMGQAEELQAGGSGEPEEQS